MASICKWGGYEFASNEVNLVTVNRHAKYSERNRRLQNIISMQCYGEIQGELSTQLSRMADIENALKNDGRDFRYEVNGSLAHSMLNSGDCISGTRIVQRSFPKGDAAELANRRSFSFTVQGIYDAKEGDDLVSWQETVEVIGNGGPDFFVLRGAGSPVAIFTAPVTEQRIRQTGSAVGYAAYPTPPGYVGGTGPNGTVTEYGPAQRIIRSNPKQLGNGYRFWPIRWYYQGVHDPSTFGNVSFLPNNR